MNTKRILTVVVALVIIILIVGLYFLFSSSQAPAPATQTGLAGGTLPSAGNQNNTPATGALATGAGANLGKSFGVISNRPALNYFVDSNNNVFSVQPDGEIDETTGGQTAIINSLTIQGMISTGFSYDGKKVFVSFGSPADPQTSVFDIAAKTWTPMSAGWQSPAWSPSDYRVAYATENPKSGTESFWTLDASKPKAAPAALLTLHAEDLSLAWLNKNELVLATKPSSLVAGSAWLFNIQNGVLTPIAAETPGLETAWSETASAAAASMPVGLQFSTGASNFGGSLQLINAAGSALQQIKFLTLPLKCTFASATSTTTTSYLYCGVPRDQSDLAFDRLPDDYNQMALFTSDNIYRIDLSSGAVDTVFNNQNQNVDVSDLKLFNGTLFFINRYDQKLYAIQLASGI